MLSSDNQQLCTGTGNSFLAASSKACILCCRVISRPVRQGAHGQTVRILMCSFSRVSLHLVKLGCTSTKQSPALDKHCMFSSLTLAVLPALQHDQNLLTVKGAAQDSS